MLFSIAGMGTIAYLFWRQRAENGRSDRAVTSAAVGVTGIGLVVVLVRRKERRLQAEADRWPDEAA